jgi:hypothetical protein
MDTPETSRASEFIRNLGRYRMRAQRETIPVSGHGQITGCFVGPDECEEFKSFRERRRSSPPSLPGSRSRTAHDLRNAIKDAIVA